MSLHRSAAILLTRRPLARISSASRTSVPTVTLLLQPFQDLSSSQRRYQSNSSIPPRRFKSTTGTVPVVAVKEPQPEEERTTTTADEAALPKKKFLWDLGIPSLVPEWRNMFRSTDQILTDVSAGVTVGCVAVPLSLAIALASGVPAEVGLTTAAVAGVAGALVGGTTLAVTGPAAAISLLVAGAVSQHGLAALPVITLATGGLQVLSGVTRMGVVAKLVPVSVIAGFTTGVGTLILTGQLPKAVGLAAPAGLNPIEVMTFLGTHLSHASPAAAALAAGTALGMYGLPKVHGKLPAALLAVGGATAMTHGLGLDVALIGAIPSGLGAFTFGVPVLPPLEALPSLAATTFLIYGMTSVESLLSCVALEKMKKTTYKHNSDQELIGQGLANVGASAFMGMPVTSVIARSSLNVRLNATSRLPALVQAGFVFSSVVFFSDAIALIPLPALSGVLITTGAGMLNPAELGRCTAVTTKDWFPFAVTTGGMLTYGLAEGIGMGCLAALAVHYRPGVESSLSIARRSVDTTNSTGVDNVWNVEGPLNFVGMMEIDRFIQRIDMQAESSADATPPVVLNLRDVTSVEYTGVEELVNRLLEGSRTVTMVLPSEDKNSIAATAVRRALEKCDPKGEITVQSSC